MTNQNDDSRRIKAILRIPLACHIEGFAVLLRRAGLCRRNGAVKECAHWLISANGWAIRGLPLNNWMKHWSLSSYGPLPS